MKAKRIALFFGVLCLGLLFCLPVTASDPPTIYLSGTGSDSNSGLTSSAPVASLGKAIERLNGEGGTIVVCGDVIEQTGLTIPVQSAPLYITSSFDGTNYHATLSFGSSANQASKNLFFTSDTQINHLTLNYNIHSSASSKLLTLYSGSSLTIGEDVKIMRTDENAAVHTEGTQVAIRGGVYGANIAETEIHVASGTYRYILAGNSSADVGDSAIAISGTANVYDFIQSGGVNGTVGSAAITISGGFVNTLYVDGYDKNMTDSVIDISGGSVGTITGHRGGITDITSQLSLSIGNKTLNRIGKMDLDLDYSADKVLNLVGPNQSGETYIELIDADFSDWDEVMISDYGTVYLNANYQSPQSSITVESGSQLVLTEDTTIPAELNQMPNVSLGAPIIFIDPEKGDNANSGRSPALPKSTWGGVEAALNQRGGTVVVFNDTVMVKGRTTPETVQKSLPELDGPLTITGTFNGMDYESTLHLGKTNNDAKIIVSFVTPATLENITVRYNRSGASDTTAEIWSGQSLTIGENVKVEATGTNNSISLRSGYYDQTAANASLSVFSGSWNYVQGGNSQYNVNVSHLTFGANAVAQYIQGGGTYKQVGVSHVNITGGTVLGAYYVNGYGSTSKAATLGSANIVISGGNIAAIYDARNIYSPVTGTVTLTYTGDGMYGVGQVDLDEIGMIGGDKKLVFSEAPLATVNGDFSQWDTVTLQDNSHVYVKWEYIAPDDDLVIHSDSGIHLYSGTNANLPAYSGGGAASFVNHIARTTDQGTEKLYMALEVPESHDGTDVDKEQGMAVYGDDLFIFYNDGVGKVYDLNSKSSTPMDTFHLGSYNEGVPNSNFANHSNTAMFSDYHYVDPATGLENDIPLLMVRTGTGSGANATGYYARLSIENVVKTVEGDGSVSFSSQVLQTVVYNDYYDGSKTVDDFNAANGTSYVPVAGFGAPMWMVDSENDAIYILSAKYRTTFGSVGNTATYPGYYTVDDNYYVVTQFDMTDWTAGGTVVLTPQDIRDQFTTELAAFSTQGGTLHDEKIIYAFGFGQIAGYNPNTLLVFDLNNQNIAHRFDLSRSMFAFEEMEGCAVYNGKLLVDTQAGFIYELDMDDWVLTN